MEPSCTSFTVNDLYLKVHDPSAALNGRFDDPSKPWYEPNFLCSFLGSTKSGKSHFADWLLYHCVKKGVYEWGILQSGSAEISNDFRCMEGRRFRYRYPGLVKEMYEACQEWKAEQIRKRAEKEGWVDADKINLPSGLFIEDDQIGNPQKDRTLVGNDRRDLYRYLATQSRRLANGYWIFAQYPTHLGTVERDNGRYIFLTSAHGRSLEYIYEMVNKHNIWQSQREFVNWASPYLHDFQVLAFDGQALHPGDAVRIFKAPAERPKYKWKMRVPAVLLKTEMKFARLQLYNIRAALLNESIDRETADKQMERITRTQLGIDPQGSAWRQRWEMFLRDDL